MDIKDKIAIVTGASSGIGLAVAKALSANGVKVVLAARSVDKLNQISSEMHGAFVVPTDMRKPEDVKNLIDQTLKKFGRIDILINNAGQGVYGPVEKINIDDLKKIMELNVYAVVRAMQAVIPIMKKQGRGLILNVSSRVSKNYFPGLAAYASTKYALNAISLTARQELEADKIVVSVFHPKMTATNFGKNAIGSSPVANDTRHTGRASAGVDTADQVAEQIINQIKSEAAEAMM